MATGPSLLHGVGYDARKDFAPIGMIGMAPALLLVHPSVPYRNVTDLIADIKASKEPFQVARRASARSTGGGALRPTGRRKLRTFRTRDRSR